MGEPRRIVTTENPDAEVVREALGRPWGLFDEKPSDGHGSFSTKVSKQKKAALEALSRLEAQAALVPKLEEVIKAHKCIVHFTAGDGGPAMRTNDNTEMLAALSSIPSQEERA